MGNANSDSWNPDDMDSNELAEGWEQMAKSLRSDRDRYAHSGAGANARAVADDQRFEEHLRRLHEEKQEREKYQADVEKAHEEAEKEGEGEKSV